MCKKIKRYSEYKIDLKRHIDTLNWKMFQNNQFIILNLFTLLRKLEILRRIHLPHLFKMLKIIYTILLSNEVFTFIRIIEVKVVKLVKHSGLQLQIFFKKLFHGI